MMKKKILLLIGVLTGIIFMLLTLTNCHPMHRGFDVTAESTLATAEIGQIVTFKGIVTVGDEVQSKLYDMSGVKTEFEKFEWNFGDEGVATSTTSRDATHVYTKPGAYTSTFTVYTKDGRQKDDTCEVTILKLRKPSNLTLTDHIDYITLNWKDDSKSESGFVIQRREDDTEYSTLATVPSNTTSYKDSNVATHTTYWYRVRAYNGYGVSDWSNEASKLGKPSNLTLTDHIDYITLNWEDNSESESGFVIQKRTDDTEYSTLTIVSTNTTSYEDGDVATYTTYWYRVRAYNSYGTSDWSNEASRTGYAKMILSATNISRVMDVGSSKQTTTFSIRDDGKSPLTYRITKTATSWFTVSPTGGTIDVLNNTSITVTLDPAGLEPGTYTGSIYVGSNDPAGTKTIAVQMGVTYTVSGYTRDASGNGVSDVTISFSSGVTPTMTGATGYWSKSGLAGSVTVTPSKAGWEFTPSSTTVSGPGSDVNFTGTLLLKWKYKAGDCVISSPAIGEDGTIYVESGVVGSDDGYGYLYALNQDDTLKWRYKTGFCTYSSPAIGSDGTIYVGSCDYYLYALNQDGTLKWKYETGYYIESSPAIGSDGTIYVGSDDNYLYAINPDGTLKWGYETRLCVHSSPAIGKDGTIYVGSDVLYALNPDGSLKWKYETGSYVFSSPAIGEDGTIYVGSYDHYLYAINPDGSLKWKYETGSYVFSSPAIGEDRTIYVGSGNGYLYAINPDGSLKWKYGTGEVIWYSSPAIDKDGTIYVGSQDHYLYAINPDGTLKWKYETGYDVWSSPAIGSNGTIYEGSQDGYLYAINGSSGGLADTPWPMFHHDVSHSGRKSE